MGRLPGVMLQEGKGRSRLVFSEHKQTDLAFNELQTFHQLEEQPRSQPSHSVPVQELGASERGSCSHRPFG